MPFKLSPYAAREIEPDEIFLDSQNLPQFDTTRLEGQLEQPISKRSIGILGLFSTLLLLVLLGNAGTLQLARGAEFRERSDNNHLRHIPFFADRGIIYDRNEELLAWNSPDRTYQAESGNAHVLGYVGFPTQEEIQEGAFFPEESVGKTGAERVFNAELRGESGLKIIETNASGGITSESVYEPPKSGDPVILSIDSRIQEKLYSIIESVATERGFTGGAGSIMDIKTGELIALVSYPEYSSSKLAGPDRGEAFGEYLKDTRKPLLNRATGGVYTPGSIIKPFVALAALNEKIIRPEKEIVSTGALTVQNPYNPAKKSVFTDWKAHGAVDMRRAIAVSSNVYFYEIGGGYKGQKGLGISAIEKYATMFGFGTSTGIDLESDSRGVVPSPAWKAENFDGEEWLLGDTYHTSIGQYGFGVTLVQVVRAMGALASKGTLVVPTIQKRDLPKATTSIPIAKENFTIVHEGMRQAVTSGTAAGLNIPGFMVGAKTGTAELGISKARVNSWVTGFFPYEEPRYAFAVVMERGERHNTIGGVFVMRQMFDWMLQNAPEYTKSEP